MMQNLLSFAQSTSTLPVASVSTETMKSESSDGSFSESFFSMILGQYASEEEQTPLSETALPVTTQENDTLELLSSEGEAKSIDEHLLEDLLSVVSTLQDDPTATVFPTLNASSSLEKLVASETTRQEFASVKNVSDLLALSQKYNLGLEKLTISTESAQSLQAKFPTLAENNFFDDLQTALTTAQSTTQSDVSLSTTASSVMSLLDKQSTQTQTSSKSSMLSELISKENLSTQTDGEVESLEVNEKQQTVQAFQEETTETSTKPLDTLLQKVTNANETKKTLTAENASLSSDDTSVETSTTRVNAVPVERVHTEDESIDSVLTTLKTDKTSDEVAEEEIALSQKIVSSEESEVTSTSSEDSQSTLEIKNDLKTTLRQEITSKTATVKESLNQFASDLQEKIDAYKPPIMKVELSLSPQSLGDVDVTLLTRGNNLHVTISSNTSTMSLFTQNQNDVKSALINMGFTNLEMNFSDQNNKEQAQQNQKNSSGSSDEFTTESSEEETTLLEIVIPQYV